jgi:DNA-binding transcriptional MerR regulator
MDKAKAVLPPIPAKRYFTIGEVSDLCMVKPHVLRYWEQEFTQLRPMKRRGNRRYYQHHEVLLVRRIRDLLYEQGFTISGARNQLGERIHEVDAEPSEALGGSAQGWEADPSSLESPSGASSQALHFNGARDKASTSIHVEQLSVDLPRARAYLTEALHLLS